MDGLLVIDKPVGPTSHDVVARVRQVLGERRVGHTGTLDPAASGVLPLVIGRATRLAQFLSRADKVYEATIRLGVKTDTYDGLGQPVGAPHLGALPTQAAIDRALDEFRGEFLQRPPAYSAKKVGGHRSYKVAREAARDGHRGRSLPAAVSVTAHAIELVGVEADRLALRVTCGAGFYVRSLAHDLGEILGIGAHLEALRRTRSGDAAIADALPLATVERDPEAAVRTLVPLAQMLPQLAAVVLTDEGVRRAVHGLDLGPADVDGGPGGMESRPTVRLLDSRGVMVGIAVPGRAPGLLHPCVVLM